jgi:5-methylcytosine-specific restriction protein A
MKKNFGILASIDWNSNKWKKYPTPEDIENSKFGYVKKENHTYTYLNFAHKELPGLKEGEYEALIPHFWSELPSIENRLFVNVVFIKSKNYIDGRTYIVGLYAFPRFENLMKNVNTLEKNEVIEVNLISRKEDILLLDNPVDITESSVIEQILPKGKKAGKMNYNYLTSDNVKKILDLLRHANPEMIELKSINGIKARLLKVLPVGKISDY